MPHENGTALTVRKPPKEALAQLERVVIEGDLATLSDQERIGYYARVCESLGLNPLTRPFEYIRLNSKLTLYARKDATDQLRKINAVSVERLERERDAELAIVTAYGRDRSGRTDSAIGAVSIKGLSGEGLANALMKAETKAKRRLTLSLAGLGWLDETEAEGPLTATVSVDPATGAIETSEAEERRDGLRDRIAQRTAALRGESTGEPEAVQEDGGAEPEDGARQPSSGGSPSRGGDPWMRKIHGLAAERGMDHGALHDWAVEHFRVESLNDLTPPQRATFTEIVEGMPLMPQPEAGVPPAPAPRDTPPVDGQPSSDVSAAATASGSDGELSGTLPPSSEPDPAQPTMEDILAATGGTEIVEPPRPGTDLFKALTSQERAQARAYWARQEAPKGARETHEAVEVPS